MLTGKAPLFEKGCYGLLKQPRWDLDEMLEMKKKLDSGKITCLVVVV
jgi:hypothetical protein